MPLAVLGEAPIRSPPLILWLEERAENSPEFDAYINLKLLF